MEKYYIVTKDSPVHQAYLQCLEMSDRVNEAFKAFAQEEGVESSEYYQRTDELYIIPMERDMERFGTQFRKDWPGRFKKTSVQSKRWIARCRELGLQTPRRPNLNFVFRAYGSASQRLFMAGDVMYASYESSSPFQEPEGFTEIKASEFYKALEDVQAKAGEDEG